jgi:hypothetical protein
MRYKEDAMALTLHLPPDIEQRLVQASEQQGVPAEEYMLQLLDRHLPPADRRASVIALLESWLDEAEEAEQRETGDYLVRVLDQDRLSDRPLFPEELKGVSW